MTDIFLSYSSKDRERVRVLHDALVAAGYSVFWDQTMPVGVNWNRWIMERLGEAHLVVVLWSKTSVYSDPVIHEASIAREEGKLIPCALDVLATRDFPMGFYTTQAAALTDWEGQQAHAGYLALLKAIGARLANKVVEAPVAFSPALDFPVQERRPPEFAQSATVDAGDEEAHRNHREQAAIQASMRAAHERSTNNAQQDADRLAEARRAAEADRVTLDERQREAAYQTRKAAEPTDLGMDFVNKGIFTVPVLQPEPLPINKQISQLDAVESDWVRANGSTRAATKSFGVAQLVMIAGFVDPSGWCFDFPLGPEIFDDTVERVAISAPTWPDVSSPDQIGEFVRATVTGFSAFVREKSISELDALEVLAEFVLACILQKLPRVAPTSAQIKSSMIDSYQRRTGRVLVDRS